MSGGMRILVTNDDGIHAPGLAAAEKIARALSDDVWVVAPETEQSGASHSLTLTLPLRLRQIEPKRFAVTGTPTDCVMMACAHVMKESPPTLLLSGVNRGSNIADDVTYSGTIAGATEGAEIPWACGEVQGPPLIRKLVEVGWPEDVLMNINFPDAAPGEVKGVDIASQGKRDLQTAALERRIDARGNPYFWIGFKRVRSNPPEGTDLHAIYNKRIAVTPLHLNLTEFEVLQKMKQKLGKISLA
jgi:5'-nucleotidase